MSVDILLLAGEAESGVAGLARAITARGGRPACVDLHAFPEGLALLVDAEGIHAAGRRLDSFAAAYARRGEYMSPVPSWVPPRHSWPALRGGMAGDLRRRQESRSVVASVYKLLSERIPVVCPAGVQRLVRLQPLLLRILEQAGLPVAPFVSGNDLERFAYFVDEQEQCCRARRIPAGPADEIVCDFAYLKEHHLDLDRHPLLVRRAFCGPARRALAFAEGPVLLAGPAGGDEQACCALARAVLEAIPSPLALVHLELDQAGAPWLTAVDVEPDLAAFEEETGLAVTATMAELLLRLAGRGQPLAEAGLAREALPAAPAATRPAPPRRPLRIGLSGRVGDAEVAAVRHALERLGHEALPLELPLFPARRALHEERGGGRIGMTRLEKLDAVYHRAAGSSSPLPGEEEPLPSPEEWEALHLPYARYTSDENDSFLLKYVVLEQLTRRIPLVNPPSAQEVHRTKIHQLFSLLRAGIRVPPTVAGNDLARCTRFVAEMGGEERVVHKPLAGIYKTRLLAEVGLDHALAQGPAILQRYIRGPTLRAYIVGGRLVGAGRLVQQGDAIDSSVGQIGVEPFDLPEAAVAEGWRAARHLGLSWTGMDFLLEEATGELFVLECNASAMFANFSRMTGFDVPAALAELLIGLAGRRWLL